jgi:hypothetical protein
MLPRHPSLSHSTTTTSSVALCDPNRKSNDRLEAPAMVEEWREVERGRRMMRENEEDKAGYAHMQ